MRGPDESHADFDERSRYDLMRSKHVIVPLSVPWKLRWCGFLALLAALVGPVIATLPTPVREAYFDGNPTTTPLGAATVVLFGVVAAALATGGLTAVAAYVDRHPDPDESRVWLLIGAEDVFSGFGFITATLGVISGGVILASGHWGVDAVERLHGLGIEPYLVFEFIPATPRLTAIVAFVVGVCALASSVFADTVSS